MNQPIDQTIEAVYQAFSRFRRGPRLSEYPYWELAEEDRRVVLGAPLESIPADVLGRYVYSATAFGRPDYDWWPFFVPRVVELVASYQWPHPWGEDEALSLLHSNNDYGKPLWQADFTQEQLSSLDEFERAFWQAHVARPYHCISLPRFRICGKLFGDATVSGLLTMFLNAGFPIAPILEALDGSEGALADIHVADFVNAVVCEASGMLDPDLPFERAREPAHLSAAKAGLEAWLAQPALGERLMAAYERETRRDERQVLDLALLRLILTGGFVG
jgi:hypothetical protein